jgi:hypothetical protein
VAAVLSGKLVERSRCGVDLLAGSNEQFAPTLDLRRNILGRRSADRASPRKRIPDIENLHYIIAEVW